MRVYFEEVSQRAKKSGKCSVCGKPCTRSIKFFQTLNPFNKNEDGSIKTRGQIYAQQVVQIAMWKKIPPFHEKCRIR